MSDHLSYIAVYSTIIWFFFYLTNYAVITEKFAEWVKHKLGPKFAYPTECPLCTGFWVTLVSVIFFSQSIICLFTVPVGVLFIDLAYQKLVGGNK